MQSDIVIAYVRCYPMLFDTDRSVSVMGPSGSGKSNASDINIVLHMRNLG